MALPRVSRTGQRQSYRRFSWASCTQTNEPCNYCRHKSAPRSCYEKNGHGMRVFRNAYHPSPYSYLPLEALADLKRPVLRLARLARKEGYGLLIVEPFLEWQMTVSQISYCFSFTLCPIICRTAILWYGVRYWAWSALAMVPRSIAFAKASVVAILVPT